MPRPRPHLATTRGVATTPPKPTDPYWTLWLALVTAPLVWWG